MKAATIIRVTILLIALEGLSIHVYGQSTRSKHYRNGGYIITSSDTIECTAYRDNTGTLNPNWYWIEGRKLYKTISRNKVMQFYERQVFSLQYDSTTTLLVARTNVTGLFGPFNSQLPARTIATTPIPIGAVDLTTSLDKNWYLRCSKFILSNPRKIDSAKVDTLYLVSVWRALGQDGSPGDSTNYLTFTLRNGEDIRLQPDISVRDISVRDILEPSISAFELKRDVRERLMSNDVVNFIIYREKGGWLNTHIFQPDFMRKILEIIDNQ